jgi:hypothetical protein
MKLSPTQTWTSFPTVDLIKCSKTAEIIQVYCIQMSLVVKMKIYRCQISQIFIMKMGPKIPITLDKIALIF